MRGVRCATKASGFLGLLLSASPAIPQETAPAQTVAAWPSAERATASSTKITYVDGQLKISALHVTMADVLAKVSAVTGVKIDLPEGASNERLPIVELGPGPAREVLASLLSDTNFDYLILASDSDPLKLQSVLVMPREKKGSSPPVPDPPRNRYAKAVAPPPEPEPAPPVPDNPAPAQAAEPATALNQQPPAAPADPSAPPPTPDQSALASAQDPSMPSQTQQPGMLNGLRIAPQPVPSNLDQQSINQTLQQMYQQRQQLQPGTQQQTAQPAVRQ